MFDTYQYVDYSLRPRAASFPRPWCQSVVVIHVKKWYPAGVETPAQSPTSRVEPKETSATKAADAATPWGVLRDMCLNHT